MKVVRAWPDSGDDLGAGLRAVLSRVPAGLHPEFFDRLHRWAHPDRSMDRRPQRSAIEVDRVVLHLLAHGGDAKPGSESAGGDAGCRAAAHPGSKQRQPEQVAVAGQRQFPYLRPVNHRTDRRIVGIHRQRLGVDADLLRHLADLQLHVDALALIHLQRDAAHRRLAETRHLDAHFIYADLESGNFEQSALA